MSCTLDNYQSNDSRNRQVDSTKDDSGSIGTDEITALTATLVGHHFSQVGVQYQVYDSCTTSTYQNSETYKRKKDKP